jgi:hypothetical protein
VGYGDSPYQCFSAFAGNPLILSLDRLVDRGYLSQQDIARRPQFPASARRLRCGNAVEVPGSGQGSEGILPPSVSATISTATATGTPIG